MARQSGADMTIWVPVSHVESGAYYERRLSPIFSDPPRSLTALDSVENTSYIAGGSSSYVTPTTPDSSNSSQSNFVPLSQSQNRFPIVGHQGPVRTHPQRGYYRFHSFARKASSMPRQSRMTYTEADLSRLNDSDESSQSIVQHFHDIIEESNHRDLEIFERHGGFDIGGRNDRSVEMRVIVEGYENPTILQLWRIISPFKWLIQAFQRLRINARRQNNSITEMDEPLTRVPYNQASLLEFNGDDDHEDHSVLRYSDGQPRTDYAIQWISRHVREYCSLETSLLQPAGELTP